MSFDIFTGNEKITKTLRFELRPTLFTQRHIEDYGIVTLDELRAEKSVELKKLLDDYYRAYIDKRLSVVHNLDWRELFTVMDSVLNHGGSEERKKLENIKKDMRGKVNDELDANKKMFAGNIITHVLPDFIKNNSDYTDEEKEQYLDTVKLFSGFTTSFGKFFTTRKNVFSDDKIHTSICYRIVDENSVIFYQNMRAYQKINENASQEIEKIEAECRQQINEWKLSHIYSVDYYNNVLTQRGIEFYNDICGRINLHMNLYCQQTKEKSGQYRMKKLHKQILSISSTSFEVPYMYKDDNEVYDSINMFIRKLEDNRLNDSIVGLLQMAQQYDYKQIFIDAKSYANVSNFISGSWDTVINSITRYYDENTTAKKNKQESVEKKVKGEKYRSLSDIYDIVARYVDRDMLKSTNEYEYLCGIKDIYRNDKLQTFERNDKKLIEDDESVAKIKEMLDMLLNTKHFLDTFTKPEAESTDAEFYDALEEVQELLDGIVALYNKVRNYVTQKPYHKDKIQLRFDCSSLGTGWSKSKEFDYKTIILRRNGLYYLAIYNPKNKPDKALMEGHTGDVGHGYEKMVYDILPTKRLINWCVESDAAKEKYNPSQYIIDGCKNDRHAGKNFDINFCHDLIDYLKACININGNWKTLKFNFSDTGEYNNIKDFYDEIEMQGYKLSWVNISKDDIDRLDKEGQIYLFQIYNKDFSDNSTGTPNLHTMYFRNLFSEENIREGTLKLNGGAELFFRKASIDKRIEHKKGTVLVNKTYKTVIDDKEVRVPIPDKEYQEIYEYYKSGRSAEPSERKKLSKTAQEYLDKVEIREASKDIVKDRRYTQDKYFLHTSVIINYKASKNKKEALNDKVLDYISTQKDLHIIGIDRGERNLIYVSVIDMNGRIVKQKSYNIVGGYNYQRKLVEREKIRDEARKSWKEVGRITDLKEGYLSQVVHEIAEMVLEYNAVIAMEDLNYGFKRGRFKIERQVYQKFESMLISKLNYLVDKKKKVDEPGGILKGYQLTYIPQSIKDVGRQCGIIFYVQPAYTSKIDPTTGFADLFNFKACKSREFLTKFDNISYVEAKDGQQDMFAFSFDYDNFVTHNTTPAIKKWTAYTFGSRIRKDSSIENGRRAYKTYEQEPTAEIKQLLEDSGIEYGDGHNIIEDIKALEENEGQKLIDGIFYNFRLTVQLRNSKTEAEEYDYDRIISPIMNANGEFFDSFKYRELAENGGQHAKLPIDADANGAYCIAMKCLIEMNRVQKGWDKTGKNKENPLFVSDADWFDFMQNKRYL